MVLSHCHENGIITSIENQASYEEIANDTFICGSATIHNLYCNGATLNIVNQ